jgi:spore germination cell wall hydrolase CwlJ-like protein
VAEEVYYRRRSPALHGVLHYHSARIKPPWASEHVRVARIGRHVFYR